MIDIAERWQVVSKKAYWDRDVPLERWQEKVAEAHPSYLPGAIASMKPAEFILFYKKRKLYPRNPFAN